MNPYQAEHAAAEAVFQDGDTATANRIVANEYRDAPPAIPCGCGSMAYYKATIGALKCVGCGRLYWEDGEEI